MEDKCLIVTTIIVDLQNYEDDFFKTDDTGIRQGIIERLKSQNKLEQLITILVEKYFALKDSHKPEKGNQTINFPCIWNKWLREFSFEEFPIHFGSFDCGDTVVALTIYWIASKVADTNLKFKRAEEIAALIAKQKPIMQIKSTFLKKPLRNMKTDELYSLCRLGGGCLGEMWRINKANMQINQKILKGKKPLTQHQRDKAHIFYKISLSLRNMDQFPKDIPPALIHINKGGLLIPHESLMGYVKKSMIR